MHYGSRLRQIGWVMVLSLCFAAFGVLTVKVNSVKSKVRVAERQIAQLKREKIMLETEFETRASQQKLAEWNRVEFGYLAPQAAQYLESERQLAALGSPRSPDAPAPIQVAAYAPKVQDEGAVLASRVDVNLGGINGHGIGPDLGNSGVRE